ncbi:hypothetical protein R1sor_013229 [Riccia sorocarpa]|uniref:Reverse transcriptase domain-containing protein n=1 Tax=Riccia sorocarpa TaxID=122646 RepID=A0ABD3H977_9MARC
MPGGRIVIDYTCSGRGGCALLINPNLRVSEVGTSTFGGAAWATIHAASGLIRVASLHASNTKEEHQVYWNWWDQQVDGEDYIMAGDFNNVELQDNSKGKSALISGAEERAWKRLTYRTDMVEAYLAAVDTEGGLFTRLAFCGERFDRARLDRFYLSNGGDWCHLIKKVKHHSDQLLSDHIPIALELQLLQDDDCNWRPRSYFKMAGHLVEKPHVLQAVKDVWDDHPPFCRSRQKRWELAWGRVKQVLREEKRKLQEGGRHMDDTRREVIELRIRSEQGELSSDVLTLLKTKEDELRQNDIREAKIWKCRSKERWLKEGEAPSKYFYLQLKAKFSREKITALEDSHGQTATDHKEILQQVEAYYKQLYTRGEATEDVTQARTTVLSNLTRRINTAEDEAIHSIPSPEEIDEVVDRLAAGKSPGIDGLTAETLRTCWSFVRRDCIDMVQEFWCRGALTEKTRTAVIKLLPKNDQKHLLKNWRPLSLMGITYKILAKIMANRFKQLMPKLVDDLQTGFIKGRSIASNLLSLRLGADWAKISGQECMFLQLDFVKAYDRLDHGFLWQTLAAMGFSDRTIRLVKGLAQGGLATVHVNEDFTATIPIQRGVRQGCPMAPYLFTLTTQVLMDTIQAGINDKTIKGLQIDQDHQLVHRLFANDTGLFLQMDERVFLEAKARINLFEKASGALLNLHKSVIIPIGGRTLSPSRTGSTTRAALLRELEIDLNILDYFPASLPGYTLLSLGLDTRGIQELERISRQFLWGWSDEDRSKKSLMACEVFSKPKLEGGLGWGRLESKAQAHMLKNLLKLMSANRDIWTEILEQIILTKVKHGHHAREIKLWSAQEIMLGLNSLRLPHSDLANRMLRTWFKGQLRTFLGRTASPLSTTDYQLVQRFDKAFPPPLACRIELHECSGWNWSGAPDNQPSAWDPPTSFLRRLLHRDVKESPTLMARWAALKTLNQRTLDGLNSGGPKSNHGISRLSNRRSWLADIFQEENKTIRPCTGETEMLQSIDTALAQADRNPALLILITTALRHNWQERNEKQFKGTVVSLPRRLLLDEIKQEIDATASLALTSDSWKAAIANAYTSLARWTHMYAGPHHQAFSLSLNDQTRPPEDNYNLHRTLEETQADRPLNQEDPAPAATPTTTNIVARLSHHYENHLLEEDIWGAEARLPIAHTGSTPSTSVQHTSAIAAPTDSPPTDWEWIPQILGNSPALTDNT